MKELSLLMPTLGHKINKTGVKSLLFVNQRSTISFWYGSACNPKILHQVQSEIRKMNQATNFKPTKISHEHSTTDQTIQINLIFIEMYYDITSKNK